MDPNRVGDPLLVHRDSIYLMLNIRYSTVNRCRKLLCGLFARAWVDISEVAIKSGLSIKTY